MKKMIYIPYIGVAIGVIVEAPQMEKEIFYCNEQDNAFQLLYMGEDGNIYAVEETTFPDKDNPGEWLRDILEIKVDHIKYNKDFDLSTIERLQELTGRA